MTEAAASKQNITIHPENFSGLKRNAFLYLESGEGPLVSVFRRHLSAGVPIIGTLNENINLSFVHVYNLNWGVKDGVHVGYAFESSAIISIRQNYAVFKRPTLKSRKMADLIENEDTTYSYCLPDLRIFTVGTDAVIATLAADDTTATIIGSK